MARQIKASIFCLKLHEHVGGFYVYAMAGTTYTIADAIRYENMYGTGKKCGAGYYCVIEPKLDTKGNIIKDANGNVVTVKNYHKGVCAKALGSFATDCSGYLAWARKALSGISGRTSAQGEYERCAGRHAATMQTFPYKPGVFLFRGTPSHKTHVGCYVGDGYVIEAASAKVGIIKSRFKNNWDAWGYSPYIDYDIQTDTAPAPVDPVPDEEPEEEEHGKPDDPTFDKDHVPYLKKGHKGAMVKFLQTNLVRRGYSMPRSKLRDGSMDGDFGAETDAVVRRFQGAQKITKDGIVGPITWTKLMGYTCKG